MASKKISERVKNFIFTYIDSVEQLEILLLFYADRKKLWSAHSLASELRSSPTSAGQRVSLLESIGLVTRSSDSSSEYFYNPKEPALDEVVSELAIAYRIQRHNVFELIFSPIKKARGIADSFRKGGNSSDGGHDG